MNTTIQVNHPKSVTQTIRGTGKISIKCLLNVLLKHCLELTALVRYCIEPVLINPNNQ